jgi:selenocysteine lyase/cysteine desulfurase
VTGDLRLDHADLEAQLSDRTRVVAFPIASNAVGTVRTGSQVVLKAVGGATPKA